MTPGSPGELGDDVLHLLCCFLADRQLIDSTPHTHFKLETRDLIQSVACGSPRALDPRVCGCRPVAPGRSDELPPLSSQLLLSSWAMTARYKPLVSHELGKESGIVATARTCLQSSPIREQRNGYTSQRQTRMGLTSRLLVAAHSLAVGFSLATKLTAGRLQYPSRRATGRTCTVVRVNDHSF